LQNDIVEVNAINTDLKDGKAETQSVEQMQAKMEKYNRMMAGATIGTRTFTMIMARVDPARLQSILTAFLAGCMVCLVTLKNEVLSLITQAVDIANQIASYVKEYTKPMILTYMKAHKDDLKEYIDEEDRKTFYDDKGELNDKSLNWINFGIDLVFTIAVISVCWQLNWIL
jgi:cell division protein FtsB